MPEEEIDLSNYQLVGSGTKDGRHEVVCMLPRRSMTDDEAILQAAWLVACSEKSFEDFKKVYEAVCNT